MADLDEFLVEFIIAVVLVYDLLCEKFWALETETDLTLLAIFTGPAGLGWILVAEWLPYEELLLIYLSEKFNLGLNGRSYKGVVFLFDGRGGFSSSLSETSSCMEY